MLLQPLSDSGLNLPNTLLADLKALAENCETDGVFGDEPLKPDGVLSLIA